MKRIVITGVSRGLGAALCRALLQSEHAVAGCARSQNAIELFQARCEDRHLFSVVDIASSDAVEAWAAELLARFGVPDLLINNAGVINQNARLWDIPIDEFHRVLQVNVCGTFHVIRALLPAMIPKASGGILNFSSTWGSTTSPEVAPYCASKFAVEGLTKALAMELPAGMFAVAVNPGVIDTDMLRSCLLDNAADYPGPSEWAAAAVSYLLHLGPQENGATVRVPIDV